MREIKLKGSKNKLVKFTRFKALLWGPKFLYDIYIYSVAQQPKLGLGDVIVEVYRSYTIRHTNTHPLELL